MESKKYKVKGLTLDDVIDKLTVDMNAINFLKGWRYWDKRNQRLSQSWFNAHPRATEWAVENGLVEEVTLVHDWSGLKLEIRDSGWVTLRDESTGLFLLRFDPDTGAVILEEEAGSSGAGNFDNRGRLIITTEGI